MSAETSLKVGETPRSLLASSVDSSGVGDGEEVAYEDFPSPPETESPCWQKRGGGGDVADEYGVVSPLVDMTAYRYGSGY